MFVDKLRNLAPWELSPEAWEAQLADLVRRDRADSDELLDLALTDRTEDDPWTEWPPACPLDGASADPAALSDTAIIDTITALQHHLDWAGPRQARLLAEFTTRRPTETTPDTPRAARFSRWAPDEISLALSLSRITALNQLTQAVLLRDVLPDVLQAWEHGRIDVVTHRAPLQQPAV